MRTEYQARKRKLTAADAKTIRDRHKKGETQRALARAYGVTDGMVSAILGDEAHAPKGAKPRHPRANPGEAQRVRTPGTVLTLRALDMLLAIDEAGEAGVTKEELGRKAGEAAESTTKRILALIAATDWGLVVLRREHHEPSRYALGHYLGEPLPEGWAAYESIVSERAKKAT